MSHDLITIVTARRQKGLGGPSLQHLSNFYFFFFFFFFHFVCSSLAFYLILLSNVSFFS